MSIVERILRVFLSYAELAQGWNPQEEGDYQDFVDAVGNALAPAEQCGRVDSGLVSELLAEANRQANETADLLNRAAEALAQNAQAYGWKVPLGCVLVAIERGEGYEDVHPELVAEDCMGNAAERGWRWRVVSASPAPDKEGA